MCSQLLLFHGWGRPKQHRTAGHSGFVLVSENRERGINRTCPKMNAQSEGEQEQGGEAIGEARKGSQRLCRQASGFCAVVIGILLPVVKRRHALPPLC